MYRAVLYYGKRRSVKSGSRIYCCANRKIMTMPGLPKKPAAEQIDIDDKGNIVGIF